VQDRQSGFCGAWPERRLGGKAAALLMRAGCRRPTLQALVSGGGEPGPLLPRVSAAARAQRKLLVRSAGRIGAVYAKTGRSGGKRVERSG